MASYAEEVNRAMRLLAHQERTLFVGQSVCFDGAAIFHSLAGVPMNQRLEMPVIEDFQLGYCIGLALAGRLPICIFPRCDFLLLAVNQLVNHLDKIPVFSGFRPKVIVRTVIGTTTPLNAGPQHTQDHRVALHSMCRTIHVEAVDQESRVVEAYQEALVRPLSTVIIEAPCPR